MRAIAGILVACALGAGQDKTIQLPGDHASAELKPGPDRQLVRNNCAVCHSLDYIVRQPRSSAKQWEAETQKMIKTYGAPIGEADAKLIAAYLASAYGNG